MIVIIENLRIQNWKKGLWTFYGLGMTYGVLEFRSAWARLNLLTLALASTLYNLFFLTYWIMFLQSWTLDYIDPDLTSSGLKMEIVFKRRITNELMTTYFPSCLLLLISYATTFFKPFYFEAQVTVNLSVMLVTTNLFIRCLLHTKQ